MSNKNQQMKIAVVIVLVILLISSIIAAVRSSTSSTSVVKTEDVTTQLEDQEEEEEELELELDEDMTVTTQAMAATTQNVAAKKELGESINIRELTEDEVARPAGRGAPMMMPGMMPPPGLGQQQPSSGPPGMMMPPPGFRPGMGRGKPPRPVEKALARPHQGLFIPVREKPAAGLDLTGSVFIPFFTNPNGSVKGINQLTDEEYETLRKFYLPLVRARNPYADYPNRHKRRYIREKIEFLKEKPIIFSFLPGHEYSHNMSLNGDNTFVEKQQQLIQKGLTDEQILNWLDGWYRYSKKHKKIKLGGGQIVDEDDYQDMFPFYTLSINEIVNLVKDRKEQIEKDQKTRMNFLMYGFDDRNNQRVEGYTI